MPLPPRDLPNETVDALRPPAMPYPYFRFAKSLPFEFEADELSRVNAWWLADASLLVYGSPEFVAPVFEASGLAGQGFVLGWLGDQQSNRGMVLTHDSGIIVVLRGTRVQVSSVLDAIEVVAINQSDLWTDSQFFPSAHSVGGRVHLGFATAFAEVSDDLDAIARRKSPGQKLWITGHSLGGALANLAAAHLGRETVHGLYTYGCPRVGDAAFASVLPSRNHYRFVHRDDWVATVPPEFLGYVHAGERRTLRGDRPRNYWNDLTQGTLEFASVMKTLASEMKWNTGRMPFKISGLSDHAPIYYATLLWNELAGSIFGRSVDED